MAVDIVNLVKLDSVKGYCNSLLLFSAMLLMSRTLSVVGCPFENEVQSSKNDI